MAEKQTNERSRMISELLPNTFPYPNVYIDSGIFALLKPEEQSCLTSLIRKTYGWWKRSDRVSHSQIAEMTGLSESTAKRSMDNLVAFGAAIRLSNGNDGLPIEYAPQTDIEKISISELNSRARSRRDNYTSRMVKARASIGGLCHISPAVSQIEGGAVSQIEGGAVSQTPQKPTKATLLKTKVNTRQKTPRTHMREKAFVYPKGMSEYAYAFERIIEREARDDNERRLWAFGLPKQGIHGFSDYARDGVTPSNLLQGYKLFMEANKRKNIPITRPHTLYTFALEAKNKQGNKITGSDVRKLQSERQRDEDLN